jgi:Arc/MetJ-type ribon-helix-helix transcriptional regulator
MRLVKLLLPPDLVRQMDRAILASAGAYQDRNEFVTEAVRDRLTEDVAAQVGAGRHVSVRELSTSTAQPDGLQMFGRWRAGAPCTVDAPPGTGVNFGLHNRDLPSLWALDRLAAMTLGQGGPVAWSDFTEIVGRDALALGELLRMHDLGQPSGLRAGVGFPKPGAKADRSVERFLAGNVGTNGRRPEGPFVVLSLAAFIDPDHQSIAPARHALDVLARLIDAGLGMTLPQNEAVFSCWWSYLGALSPQEQAAWRKVVTLIGQAPTRQELIAGFPEWAGAIADTNTTGLVSRSREWGLVEPGLIEGRYRLTERGRAVATEG